MRELDRKAKASAAQKKHTQKRLVKKMNQGAPIKYCECGSLFYYKVRRFSVVEGLRFVEKPHCDTCKKREEYVEAMSKMGLVA